MLKYWEHLGIKSAENIATHFDRFLVQFFRLFCRHLASAILEIVQKTAESTGHPHCLAQRHEKFKSHAISLLPEFELQLQALLQDLPMSPVNERQKPTHQSLPTSGQSQNG